jgi:hypothetical protein
MNLLFPAQSNMTQCLSGYSQVQIVGARPVEINEDQQFFSGCMSDK